MKKTIQKENLLKILYIIASIIFVIPSIIYIIQNKTVYKFDKWFEFLLNDSARETQTIAYLMILVVITVIYILIIKYRNKIFKDIKSVLKYTSIVGFIYILSIPFTCSDVFYYMGVGRIDSTYNQNPYYTTIRQYVDENQNSKPEIINDSVMMEGYMNDWGNSTVVYGPVWQLICKFVGLLSFGNVDIGLFVFKIINLLVHIINCWLIYKLTGKKIFALIYGLNPFVLIEGIMCVHNDMFVVLFTLFALYFMKNKKKLWVSMIFLALATGIKYFSILLLPFIIIYYFRKEKPINRFLKCINYGIIFIIALLVPYLIYAKDLSILSGMITQQGKMAKSIYIPILQYFPSISINSLSTLLLKIFAIIYLFTVIILLVKKNITLRNLMQKYTVFLLIFLFSLITQFQPWYLMWLMPIFMWQNSNNVKVLVLMGIISEFANAVFLLNGEGYVFGTPFILIMYTAILGSALTIEKLANKRKIKAFKVNMSK